MEVSLFLEMAKMFLIPVEVFFVSLLFIYLQINLKLIILQ